MLICDRPATSYAIFARKRRARSAKTPSRAPDKTEFSTSDIVALFGPWEAAQGIVLGVSGGPDSVAMMLLAAEWARGRAARPPLYVATGGHRLRQHSRAEAELVGR